MIIELPIFCTNAKTAEQLKRHSTVNFDDFDINFCTFYDISAICPFTEKGKDYAEIFIGSNRFITPLTYKELKDQIETP